MPKNYLITGGAGFIGSNYVSRLLARGDRVTIFDNLSRAGAPLNLRWLRDVYGEGAFELIEGDVRDSATLTGALRDIDIVVHLAGQVAVTSSVTHPREDFECNALGTFNLLEAARQSNRDPIVLYASTNKVYGGMEDVSILEEETRYSYEDLSYGVPENYQLDFHSPYGCSKGAGDQYVRDYARIFGLKTVVLRQSCIYGPHQFGIEDQGWLAWFIIAAATGTPITIYGNGKQVRDVLYIDDLLDVFDLTIVNIEQVTGKVFNIGGGPENSLSIWCEFGPLLERLIGRKIGVSWEDWRPGDQLAYISDIRAAKRDLGWAPKVSPETGIQLLYDWVEENIELFLS
jgi:CDP-paratose 2-epimerase